MVKTFPDREVGAPLKRHSREPVGNGRIAFPDREVGAPLKQTPRRAPREIEAPFPDREVGAPLKPGFHAEAGAALVHSPTARSGLR